jgi:N-acyl-D-amino-acid deacylase
MKSFPPLIFFFIIFSFIFSCQQSTPVQQFDMLIKNGRILDGSGAEPYYAQLLIRDGLIAQIERDTSKIFEARQTIDAKGRVVSPGFIDTHTHGDPLSTPEFQNFLAMGVTTIFLGQDGSSPNTTSLASWMKSVDEVRPGVNIGMFVGHGTIRMLSGVQYDKNPSEEGLRAMDEVLKEAMEAGSFGMTTGLEYNPGYLADQAELNRLARIVGEHNGILMSHMRNEDDEFIEESLDELLAQGAYCPVHVSHIKIVYGKGEDRANEILQKLYDEREGGKVITADLYPYEASYTSISILFPEWAKPPANYKDVVTNRRKELEDYLRNRVNLRNGPEATLIGSGPFKGKNLAEIAELKNKPFEKVLVDDIGPAGASAAYFVMDEGVMKVFLKDEHVNICSDGSPTSNHPRGYGTFAKIIESYVIKDPVLTLPEAIYKMTGLAAKNVGLKDRGFIREGMTADLVIFQPENVRAKATYEDAAQLAEGFDYVIVNGKVAKEGHEFKERAGHVIRRPE